jgi:plastocyanin
MRRLRLLSAAALLLAAPASAQTPPAPPAGDPVLQRAEAFKEAAGLLEKAGNTRTRGNKSLAEQLFSSAELIVGADAVAELAPLFREGAPPRVTTPLKVIPKDTPPQPASVGNSDEDEPEPPKKGSLSGQIKLEGKPSFDGLGVVTLEPASGKFHKRKPKQRVMEQRDRQFAPKVMVVPVGSTVTFPNFDSVYHNVFSRSESAPFDLGIYKNGQARDMTFTKEGIIRLGCNLHANMSAAIVVVSEPHYAITDRNGRFNFKSLEPGKYRMRAWSEKSIGAVVQEVTVKPEANTATVTVKADQIANIDKFGAVRGKAP